MIAVLDTMPEPDRVLSSVQLQVARNTYAIFRKSSEGGRMIRESYDARMQEVRESYTSGSQKIVISSESFLMIITILLCLKRWCKKMTLDSSERRMIGLSMR